MKAKWIFIIYMLTLIFLSALLVLWFKKQPPPFVDKTNSAAFREKIAKMDQIDPVAFQAMERKVLGVPFVKIVPISPEEMSRPASGVIFKRDLDGEVEEKPSDPDVCDEKQKNDNCKWVSIQ